MERRMVMCLCPVCRQRFRDSGAYILRRVVFPQDTKDDCTYCQTRRGFDYYVQRRRQVLNVH